MKNLSVSSVLRKGTWCIALIVIVAAGLLLYQVRRARTAPSEEPVRPVRVFVLQNQLIMPARRYFGTVQGSHRAVLAFPVPGRLVSLPVETGAMVRKGDILATLDRRNFEVQLSNAKGGLSQLQARYAQTKSDYERYRQLREGDAISQAQFEQVRTVLEVSRSALSSAKAQVQAASDALKDTELRAPFDGVLAHRFVENYQELMPKQPVLSVQNLDDLEIRFDVPDTDMIRFPGIEALQGRVTFDGLPGRSFDVTFKELDVQADPRLRTYAATVTMKTPEGVTILPGMPAAVEVSLKKAPQNNGTVYRLPADAVLQKDQKTAVWVYRNGTVQSVDVMLLGYRDGMALLSGPLNQGDHVVTAGVHSLEEGQKVRLMDPDQMR